MNLNHAILLLTCLGTISSGEGKVDYTIVFAGTTDVGKSSAGNFFLNKKEFQSKKGLLSFANKPKASTATIHGKTIKIIDTCSFFADFISTEEYIEKLSSTLALAKGGIHAVALVINSERFHSQYERALEQLLRFKGILPYLFVLLTHTKDKGITKKATDQCVSEVLSHPTCPNCFKNLMQKVNSRVIMVESVEYVNEYYYNQKSEELIGMVETILRSNNNEMYTNLMLRMAAQTYEKGKQEAEKQKELLRSNLQKIEQLQKQINGGITAATGSATDNASNKIAELKEQNEVIEKLLEVIKSETFPEEYTRTVLQQLMKQSNIKFKNLSDFLNSFAYYLGDGGITTSTDAGIGVTIGAVVGAIVGAAVQSALPGGGAIAIRGAQVGAAIGRVLGEVSLFRSSVKDTPNDCSQQ